MPTNEHQESTTEQAQEQKFDLDGFYKAHSPNKFAKALLLDRMFIKFIVGEPFFASMLRNCIRKYTWDVPTAAVSYDDRSGRFCLYVNPLFFSELTEDERNAVLAHEMCHLVYEHVTKKTPSDLKEAVARFNDLSDKTTLSKEEAEDLLSAEHKVKMLRQRWNIATDLTINSMLPNIPKGRVLKATGDQVLRPCIPGEGDFVAFEVGQNSENYYRLLAKFKEFGNENVRYVIDEHDWSGSNGESNGDADENGTKIGRKTIIKSELGRVIRRAFSESAKSNQWGSVSQSMRERIETYLNPQIDWKAVLRQFVRCSIRGERYSTFKRINRKYPYQHPGRARRRTSNIAVAVDQSGSVTTPELVAFFSELANLANDVTFHVIPFATSVNPDHVFKWRKGETKLAERVMTGGTDFNAPTKFVNDDPIYDGLIIFTDMFAPEPIACKAQRMWVTATDESRWEFRPEREYAVQINLK